MAVKRIPTSLLEESPIPGDPTAPSLQTELDKRKEQLIKEFQAILEGKDAALVLEFAARCATRVRGLIPSIGNMDSPIYAHSDEMVAAIDAAAWTGIESVRDVGKRTHADRLRRLAEEILKFIKRRQAALFESEDTAPVYLETMRVGVKVVESVFWHYKDKKRPTNFAAVAAARAVTATLSGRGRNEAALVEKAVRNDLHAMESAKTTFGPLWPSDAPTWAVAADRARPLTTMDDRSILRLVEPSNRHKTSDEELKPPSVPALDRERTLAQLREALELVRTTAAGDAELGRIALDLVDGFARDLRASTSPRPSATRRTEPPRIGHPIIEDLAKLWDGRDETARPEMHRQFQGILDRFHSDKTLGSYEHNLAATRWINRIASKSRMKLLFEDRAVTLRCEDRGESGSFIARLAGQKGTAVPNSTSPRFPHLKVIAL